MIRTYTSLNQWKELRLWGNLGMSLRCTTYEAGDLDSSLNLFEVTLYIYEISIIVHMESVIVKAK